MPDATLLCPVCGRAVDEVPPERACSRCSLPYHAACAASVGTCTSPPCWAQGDEPAGLIVPGTVGAPPHQDAPDDTASLEGTSPEVEEDRDEAASGHRAGASDGAHLVRPSLPLRVKGGHFTAEGPVFEISSGAVEVSWLRIEMLCLGCVEEEFGDARAARSGLRTMIRKMMFGESEEGRVQKRPVRQTYLLDVYLAGSTTPYRFEAAGVNYRGFLGEHATLMSARNFLLTAARLVQGSTEARVDASLIGFLLGQRERIKRFASVYDFELDAYGNRERLSSLIPRAEVLLPDRLFRAEPIEASEEVADAGGEE